MGKFIVGLSGTSGSIIGFRLIAELLKSDHEVYLVTTELGKKVMERELAKDFEALIARLDVIETGILHIEAPDNFFSVIASGSFHVDGMVVAPCSMGTLAAIAAGTSDNLLTRAADVCLKERRRLILVPRETPLNAIHLENMLKLSRIGTIIIPPNPSFANSPETIGDLINQIVSRCLSALGVSNDLYKRWDGRMSRTRLMTSFNIKAKRHPE